jgi:group II intron reverse transcriptase/maturase
MPDRLIDQILAPDNLRAAWDEVAAGGGAPGVDGVTIRRWRRNWEERLVELARAMRANTYKPQPLRRYSEPKKSGGYRHIAILTLTDRVIQRAVLRVLDDRFERTFLDCSYGYRPGRSLGDAVETIIKYRDVALEYVLDADVDECFDSLDHGLLREFIRETLDDPIVLRLIDLWLEQGSKGAEERKRGGDSPLHPCPPAPKGISLGMVISPLLCNVYLHRFDAAMFELGHTVVRYADDWVALAETEAGACWAWDDANLVLEGLKLRLEPAKTQITSFDQGFEYLGVFFYRDTYSYDWQGKRIQVQGPFDGWLFSQTGPEGYRD